MTITPQRLLDQDFVQVFHQSRQLVFLKKSLDTSLENRESFLSMHALSYVTKGVQRIEPYEGALIQLQAGEIAVIKKGLYTVTDIISQEQGFEAYLIFFNDTILQEVLKLHEVKIETAAEPAYSFSLQAPEYMQHFWESVEQIHTSLLNTSPTFFDIKAWELFSTLLSDDSNGTSGSRLANLLQSNPGNLSRFMEDNFNKPLAIEDYAYLTGRSPATFRREFKLKFGSSPKKWIIQKRMAKAATLLKESIKSISEIAHEVGYESSSHFIQVFKKEFGQTPGQVLESRKRKY